MICVQKRVFNKWSVVKKKEGKSIFCKEKHDNENTIINKK